MGKRQIFIELKRLKFHNLPIHRDSRVKKKSKKAGAGTKFLVHSWCTLLKTIDYEKYNNGNR